DFLLRRVALRAVSHEHEGGRELATHAGEDAHHVRHPLDGSEVRDVDQDLVVGRRERVAAGAAAGRVILGRRDEVGDDGDVTANASAYGDDCSNRGYSAWVTSWNVTRSV